MPKYLEETENKLPFILVIGDRALPHQVFVVAEGRGLELPSLLKAVDVKAFLRFGCSLSVAMCGDMGIHSKGHVWS